MPRSEKLFIDTEFNGFGGQLISMGIAANDGGEFYEVLPLPQTTTLWVREKVIPVLEKPPVPRTIFQAKLQNYLQEYPGFTLIADWPEDIAHFNQSLIVGPGRMMRDIPSYKMEVVRGLPSHSTKPHNALSDARALRTAYNNKYLR